MDIRHPMRPFDQQMVRWCVHRGVGCHLVLTKADKLSRGPAQSTLLTVRKRLPPGATAQTFSASTGAGQQELISRLNEWYEIEIPENAAGRGAEPGKVVGEAGSRAREGRDKIRRSRTGTTQ